jgi:phenylacetate-CoA ligase
MSLKRAAFAVKNATVLRDNRSMYRQLLADERLPPHELDALQSARAIAHARFAMENTAFYRDRYSAAGFTVDDLRDPAAFAELPIIDKTDVRENFDGFRSAEANEANSKVSATGGSTGEPLRLLRDLRTPTRTIEWRLFSWWDVHPSDDLAVLVRQVRDSKDELRHNLQWWPSRRFQLDAYRMDDAHVDRFLATWEKVKPSILIGYAGGVSELARIIDDRGLFVHSPKAIAVTASPLTRAQRDAIEATFGAPAYDHYRSSEIPWIAGECSEHSGLHTFADVRKIEVIGEDGLAVVAGTTGEVVATDFTNRVFPLIRYRLGDRTTPIDGVCACGRSLPRIAPVSGRVAEAMHLPGGQIVAGEGLTQTFSRSPSAVRQFQIHQQADYSVVVRCVPGTDPHALEIIGLAIEDLRLIIADKVPIRLEVLESIPHDGGKFRYIKSDVA